MAEGLRSLMTYTAHPTSIISYLRNKNKVERKLAALWPRDPPVAQRSELLYAHRTTRRLLSSCEVEGAKSATALPQRRLCVDAEGGILQINWQ